MYKEYSYLVDDLVLNLKFESRIKTIKFKEPTIYNLMMFHKLLKENNYKKALIVLWINIEKLDFISNPVWIINWVIELIYWKKDEKDKNEETFFPSTIDFIAKRYWKLPIEVLKLTTPTQLKTYTAWIEYNLNIENNKKAENRKFKEKEKFSEEQMKNYEEIMKRVKKAREELSN